MHAPLLVLAALAGGERVVVDRDDVVIERSCTLEIVPGALEDLQGDGVIRIVGAGVTVDFAGAHLRGAPEGRLPDAYAGVGVIVLAPDVILRNARVSGFKIAVLAQGSDGLVLEDGDVSDNFRQRLLSTGEAENEADWLWPHANDGGEWRRNYGAGICIESSRGVTVRRCRARDGQNGLILDRVSAARIYDNDFSFLSGWGIALWRSSDNVLSRNALDFCVRGYSHGVYNRGQDSAGLLMFEQCSRNRIVQNSITHGGDGVFAFAGKQALGEVPAEGDFDPTRKGCNGNDFDRNDLSYAAAHGLELTFSFDNRVRGNRFEQNAICGLWGGYSQDTLIERNQFTGNGAAGYGGERGGINIEHGQGNVIRDNRFAGNACGVRLWWDEDPGLLASPWALANGGLCAGNHIERNRFEHDAVGVHLRGCDATAVTDNRFVSVGREIDAEPEPIRGAGADPVRKPLEGPERLGVSTPVGARAHLRGREHILMTEWGPYDWEGPLLVRGARRERAQVWRWLGRESLDGVSAEGSVNVTRETQDDQQLVVVSSNQEQALLPYTLVAHSASGEQRRKGLLSTLRWQVRVFPWTVDPREDEAGWLEEAKAGTAFECAELDLSFGQGGASQVAGLPQQVGAAQLPADRFGTLAEASVKLPPGRWKVSVTSDDGVRVKLDGEVLLEDWTWHAPRTGAEVITIEEPRTVRIEVAHFELDGFAVLKLAIEPAE